MDVSQTSLLAARGLTDANDRLLSADEPLADLHERCGGAIPGTLAVPELLELVRQGRRMGLRIAREFSAFDGEDLVRGFVRINPLEESMGGGCEVLVENWQRFPQADGDSGQFAHLQDDIDRASAEITARLDADQRVQVWNIAADDAYDLQERVAAGTLSRWTDYLELAGVAHHQPMHWRLLDGARCKVPGSARNWRVRLLPLGGVKQAPRGFELLLVAVETLARSGNEAARIDGDQVPSGLVGSTLTPVLRQPIARIIANAETMRARLAGPLREEYSEYAGNIASAGQHLAGMLDDLADLEAVESPDFATASEPVDLGDVARRAAGILGVRAHNRTISVATPPDIDRDQSDEVVARAEFRRVLQIAINLIGNAIAYSPEGSEVRVSVAKLTEDKVSLTVADQGPGVTEAQAELIFDKFERLGRDNDGGSGLGLYISRRLARAMGGDLTLIADTKEGAQFLLELPALDISSAAADAH